MHLRLSYNNRKTLCTLHLVWQDIYSVWSPHINRTCMNDWVTRSSPKAETEAHMAVLLDAAPRLCHCDGSPPPGTSLCWLRGKERCVCLCTWCRSVKTEEKGTRMSKWDGEVEREGKRGSMWWIFVCTYDWIDYLFNHSVMFAVWCETGWWRHSFGFWRSPCWFSDIHCICRHDWKKGRKWETSSAEHLPACERGDILTNWQGEKEWDRDIETEASGDWQRTRGREVQRETNGERGGERQKWRQFDSFSHDTKCHQDFQQHFNALPA